MMTLVKEFYRMRSGTRPNPVKYELFWRGSTGLVVSSAVVTAMTSFNTLACL
jgi:hypothetical protein